MCRDLDEALETARKLGIVSILTSGGVASAPDGIQTLNRLKQNAGNVDIMAGAGINSQNLSYMLERSGLTAFLMSGMKVLPSQMKYRNPHVNMGMPGFSEYEILRTDTKEIQKARAVLDSWK